MNSLSLFYSEEQMNIYNQVSLLTSFDLKKGSVYLFKVFLNYISIDIICNFKLKSCPVIDGLVS